MRRPLLTTAFLTIAFVTVLAPRAWAAPFDVIVPTHITINTFWNPGVPSFISSLNGLIIAGDTPLLFDRDETSAFRMTVDDPAITWITSVGLAPVVGGDPPRGILPHEAFVSANPNSGSPVD